jgi:hypothetical protein
VDSSPRGLGSYGLFYSGHFLVLPGGIIAERARLLRAVL